MANTWIIALTDGDTKVSLTRDGLEVANQARRPQHKATASQGTADWIAETGEAGFVRIGFRPSKDLAFGEKEKFTMNVETDTITVGIEDQAGKTAEQIAAAVSLLLNN